jgi:hypothetical protein
MLIAEKDNRYLTWKFLTDDSIESFTPCSVEIVEVIRQADEVML